MGAILGASGLEVVTGHGRAVSGDSRAFYDVSDKVNETVVLFFVLGWIVGLIIIVLLHSIE